MGLEPRTVVLLGAGASYGTEFRLPLMSSILDAPALISNPAYSNLAKALDLFSGREAHADLEVFLTHLDMTTLTFLERWNRGRSAEFARVAHEARRELGYYLAWRLSPEDKPCDQHAELFRRIGSKGTILSLNYDRIADSSLLLVDGQEASGLPTHTGRLGLSYQLLRPRPLIGGIPATVTERQRQSGLFLKLHGSVSWFCCPRPECRDHQEIIERNAQPSGFHPRGDSMCLSCGAQLRRVIVAPTLAKAFSETPRLELLWHLAHQRLSEATELVVIGVSLPASDYRLAWLLSSSWYMRDSTIGKRALVVVNPDGAAVNRVEAACRAKALSVYDDMSGLLKEWRVDQVEVNGN